MSQPNREEDARYGISWCSKESPMPANAPGRWRHFDAREVGEQENGWPGGDIVTYECPHCGLRFRVELAQ